MTWFTIECDGRDVAEAVGLPNARCAARQQVEDGYSEVIIIAPDGMHLEHARRDGFGDIVIYGGDASRGWAA
jgi:hypothetical protein